MSDDSLIDEFLVESIESLDRVDAELVQLESEPGDREILASVFRSIHSIKGACGFLEFVRLERVAHAGENLLSSLRDGSLAMTDPIANALLELVDAVRHMLEFIGDEGEESPEEYDELVALLSELNGSPSPAKAGEIGGDDGASDASQDGELDTRPLTPEEMKELGLEPTDGAVLAEFEDLDLSSEDEVAESDGTEPAAGSDDADAPTDGSETDASKADAATAVAGPASAKGPKKRLLGQILRSKGVDAAAIAKALDEQRAGDRRLLGEILVANGAASAKQIDEALREQGKDGAAKKKPARGSGVESSNIRVSVSHLDQLMNMVGELVLARNQLVQGAGALADAGIDAAAHRVNVITTELQESVMTMRMQPVGSAWSKFPRIVRDVSRACGKRVELEQIGKETELDKTLLEAISDPMTHLVRNAIDHGIETPEERAELGKPEQGTLTLRSFHESGQVVIEISDDGKGLDLRRIREKAVANGVIDQARADELSTRDAAQLIFHPGLSTAEKVSNISGRGVGMDVVKTNIERIGGQVDVTTEAGYGTTVRIRIPLTLAIIPALIVTVDGDRFAIPQVSLVELVRLEGETLERGIEWVQGRPVHRLRGQLLPLVDARSLLGVDDRTEVEGSLCHEEACSIVVLRSDTQCFGLVVDAINDTEEIVVKPLDRFLKDAGVYAGTTIMGDGYVALILDVMGVARNASIITENGAAHGIGTDVPSTGASDGTTRFLVCEVGPKRRVAIELDHVDRLEEIRYESVERSGSGRVVQYRNAIMPLVPLSDCLGPDWMDDSGDVWQPDAEGSLQVVVLPTPSGKPIGIVVGNVADIIDEVDSARLPASDPQLAYATTIDGKVTDVVDVRDLVQTLDVNPLEGEPPALAPATGDPIGAASLDTDGTAQGPLHVDTEQLCTFWVDGEHFGVDVLSVQEILRSKNRTRVPLTTDVVEGLLNLRGQTVTVVDLGVCFGSEPFATRHAEDPPANRMNVVVRGEEGVTSLLVDRIGDVIHVPESSREPVTSTVPGPLAELLSGVQKLDDGLLLVLDVERLAELAAATARP